MNIVLAIRQSKGTMKWKLFGYMGLLALIILITLIVGLSIMGRLNSTENDYFEVLDLQMEVFEKDVIAGFDHLAFMGLQLSDDMSERLDEYRVTHSVSFDGKTSDPESVSAMQELLMEPLYQRMIQTECSGAFVMLNTTVYDDDVSRSGVYLQKSGGTMNSFGEKVLLYRGDSQVSEKHDIMPHRKWRLEFEKSDFPDYVEAATVAGDNEYNTYRVTRAAVLPGTFEKAMLLTVPLFGNDGTFYGLCGFEVNESFFKVKHAQASKLPHLTCILTKEQGTMLDTRIGLSCGVQNGYYLNPEDKLIHSRTDGSLIKFTGEETESIGLMREISLHAGSSKHIMVVMVPLNDYNQAIQNGHLKVVALLVLLIFVAVICCLLLSRRFVQPILTSLDRLKTEDGAEVDFQIQEINDLFVFLSEKDKRYEDQLQELELEKEKAQIAYKKAQMKIDQLLYEQKQEVPPDDYQYFLEGIESLTATERTIFEYYLSGHTVKEIMKLSNVKESTIRYHNQNIYRKLGVNSLKQMLRYAALWKKNRGTEGQDNEG